MRKILFIFVCGIILTSFVQSQDIDYSNNLMKRFYAASQKANDKNAKTSDHLWVTPMLHEATLNWNKLTDDAKSLFIKFKTRPTFTGTELTASNGAFKFHYTINGPSGESVDPTDNNSNGIPDYVDNMAAKFTEVYTLYHTTTGLTVPPPDGTNGGDAKYDIYISGDEAGAGVYGYVAPETTIGDNPNSTSITEIDASTSFMVMRNNYDGLGNETGLSVTCAHEYIHATQFGYTETMDSWWMEACATWSEDFAFPGYDDNLQYLMDIFGKPDVALNYENDEGPEYNDHWYASWIFAKYLTEHTNSAIIKNTYERCINDYAIDAINNELIANHSTDLEALFSNFLIANVVMSSNSSFSPYTYSRASVYENYITNNGDFKFEDEITYNGTNLTWNHEANGNGRLMRLSADYFNIAPSEDFSVTLDYDTSEGEIDMLLLMVNTTSNSLDLITSHYSNDLLYIDANNTANYDHIILIVGRFETDCDDTNSVNYTLEFDEPLSIKFVKKDYCSIYPSITKDYINIKSNESVDITNIQVYDVHGLVVYTGNNPQLPTKINVSDFAKGLYFIEGKSNDKTVFSKKIIKQ